MEIKKLSFSYGDKKIINDLTLNFSMGKVTTLLGANGCGKSTLFNLCTKNLKANRGLIKLNGINIENIKEKEFAKQVAIVHQQNRLMGEITVRELINYGRNPYIKFMELLSEEDIKKVNNAIKLCGLEEIENEKLNKLSGGQKQRAWIAMAIAQDTDILFLDEPTTYLDIKYQIEILELVKKLNKEKNTTIIMVIHDINQALLYSDEIIAMKAGEIVLQGDPLEELSSEKISEIYDTELVIEHYNNKIIVLPREMI